MYMLNELPDQILMQCTSNADQMSVTQRSVFREGRWLEAVVQNIVFLSKFVSACLLERETSLASPEDTLSCFPKNKLETLMMYHNQMEMHDCYKAFPWHKNTKR